MALRRPVAAVAALVLVLEAVGVVLLNLFLSMVVDKQKMSLAGLDPRAMSTSAWVAGLLFGAYLLFSALILLRTAVRDVGPAGFFRIVVISCAVVQGVLGAASVGLVGWGAFLFMMVSLALIVWALVGYGDSGSRDKASSENGSSADGGSAGTPHPEPSTP